MSEPADAVLEQADELRAGGQFENAIALLAPAVDAFPDDLALKVSLALALHGSGNSNAAVAILLEVILLCDEGRALDGYEDVLALVSNELLEKSVK